MKKQYTKKQIQEAISYWEKQLAKNNYCNITEAIDQSKLLALRKKILELLDYEDIDASKSIYITNKIIDFIAETI